MKEAKALGAKVDENQPTAPDESPANVAAAAKQKAKSTKPKGKQGQQAKAATVMTPANHDEVGNSPRNSDAESGIDLDRM